jgi:hypothetical protein
MKSFLPVSDLKWLTILCGAIFSVSAPAQAGGFVCAFSNLPAPFSVRFNQMINAKDFIVPTGASPTFNIFHNGYLKFISYYAGKSEATLYRTGVRPTPLTLDHIVDGEFPSGEVAGPLGIIHPNCRDAIWTTLFSEYLNRSCANSLEGYFPVFAPVPASATDVDFGFDLSARDVSLRLIFSNHEQRGNGELTPTRASVQFAGIWYHGSCSSSP